MSQQHGPDALVRLRLLYKSDNVGPSANDGDTELFKLSHILSSMPCLQKATKPRAPLVQSFAPSFQCESLKRQLILSTLQKPLCHLILFKNVHLRTPATHSVSIKSVQERLADGLK